MRKGEVHAQVHAPQVDRDEPVPVLWAGLPAVGVEIYAGVVYKDVQAAEMRDGRIHHGLDLVLGRDIR